MKKLILSAPRFNIGQKLYFLQHDEVIPFEAIGVPVTQFVVMPVEIKGMTFCGEIFESKKCQYGFTYHSKGDNGRTAWFDDGMLGRYLFLKEEVAIAKMKIENKELIKHFRKIIRYRVCSLKNKSKGKKHTNNKNLSCACKTYGFRCGGNIKKQRFVYNDGNKQSQCNIFVCNKHKKCIEDMINFLNGKPFKWALVA